MNSTLKRMMAALLSASMLISSCPSMAEEQKDAGSSALFGVAVVDTKDKEPVLTEQTIEVSLFTDRNMTQLVSGPEIQTGVQKRSKKLMAAPKAAGQNASAEEATISISGELPEGTMAAGWPASPDMGKDLELIKAYELVLIDTEGQQKPLQDVDVQLNIAADPDAEVYSVSDQGTRKLAASIDSSVRFRADGSPVYAVVRTILEKTLVASDNNTYKITVEYDSDSGLPSEDEGARLDVSELTGSTFELYKDKTAKAMGVAELSFARAFDISIVDTAGTKYQPTKDVSVSIQLMNKQSLTDAQIVHFGKTTDVITPAAETSADGVVLNFKTDGFSVYVIGKEDTSKKVNYRFWLDESDINSNDPLSPAPYRIISLKNNESLLAPADPADESRGQFLGWYTKINGTESTFSCDGATASIAEDATADKNVDIYAKFDAAQYATFQSLYIDMKRTVFHTKTLTKTGDTYSLELSTVPTYGAPVGYKFLGWSLTQPTDSLGYGENIAKGSYYAPDATITGLTGSVTLYPVAKKMYTVSLDGNGGTIAGLPVYKVQVTNDDVWETAVPAYTLAVRPGYTRNNGYFDGPDNSATAVTLSGDVNLLGDTTYYIHWNPSTTTVTVKYWKEAVKTTDPSALIDSEKIMVPTGTTLTLNASSMTIPTSDGGSVTLAADTMRDHIANGGTKANGGSFAADSELNYFYTSALTNLETDGTYHSTSSTSDLTFRVADDGSSIIDVWYKRTTYQIKFVFEAYGKEHIVDRYCATYAPGISSISKSVPASGYYTIRLGESLAGKWPDLTDNTYLCTFLGLGYKPVALGKLLTPQNSGRYPDCVSSIFTAPLSNVTEELLACTNASNRIELWGRYDSIHIRGGTKTATLKENFIEYNQNNELITTTRSQNYNYGEVSRASDNATAEWQTSYAYSGYVLDATRSLNANTNVFNKRNNNNGTIAVQYKYNGPYTMTVYYNPAPYIIHLNYGTKRLATSENSTIPIKHTQPIQAYLQSNSDMSAVFADPTEAACTSADIQLPSYMVWDGKWYTDESCNPYYEFSSTMTMPTDNVILYTTFHPIDVTVHVDNGIETGDQTITDPQLNLSGSEMGSSIRYLYYQQEHGTSNNYAAHTHTIAEFLPTYWVTPVWENHVFTGWQIRERRTDGTWNDNDWEALVDINTPVDNHIQLKATWQEMTRHNIHYIENGKEVYLDPEAYVEGATVVIKGTNTEIYDKDTKKTYVFRYWTDGTDTYVPGQTITMGHNDITLTAVFEEGGITTGSEKATYTFITRNAEGTDWDVDNPYYVEIVYRGERLSPPPETPTQGAADVFEGWYLDTALTKRFEGFGETINAPVDTTLYASFKRPWRVTYRGYDPEGDGELITVQTYAYNGTENLNTMGVGQHYTYQNSDALFALIGWDTTERTSGDVHTPYYSGYTDHLVTGDMILYPVLEDGYWLSYYQDQDMVTIQSVYYARSQNLNFTWPDPDEVTRTGYDFTGKWYTKNEGAPDTVTTITNETLQYFTEFNWNQTLTKDTTIYAGWTPKPDLKSKYSVVWWVEKADSTGDANDLDNYFYANAETVTDVPVGTQIGPNTVISGSAASNVSHVSTNIIAARDRDYFAFNKAIISYVKGVNDASAKTLSAGQTAPVDYSDMTTLNIYIQRVRYTLTFNLNNNGTIYYPDNQGTPQAYTNSWVVPGGVWLDMPYGNKWPIQSDDENYSGARLVMGSGKNFNTWQTNISGAYSYTTRAVIVEREYLTQADHTFTFTLQTKTNSGTPSMARYRFRDWPTSEYEVTDYNGDSYDQYFPNGAIVNGKTFVGYDPDTDNVAANNKTTEPDSFKYYRPFYYSNNTTSGTPNSVTFRIPGTGNNKVDIIGPNGNVYNGSNRIYFYDRPSGGTRYSASAEDIRSGSSTYFNGTDIYTYYYTRQKHDIYLHDADGNQIPEGEGGIIRDVLVGSKLYLQAAAIGTPGDHGIETPQGKQFGGDKSGWSRHENALVDQFDAHDQNAEMPLYDIQYYLQWEDRTVTVTVKMSEVDGNGNVDLNGTEQAYGPLVYYTKLSEFNLQSQDIPGYKFLGWVDVTDGSDVPLTIRVVNNMTLKGKYMDLRSKALYYDLNGGTLKDGQTDPIPGTTKDGDRYKDNDQYMVGASVPVKNIAADKIKPSEGRVDFAYWNTAADGSGEIYYPNDAIAIPGETEVTLYAIYAPQMDTTLVYRYDVNDATVQADVNVKFYDYRVQNRPAGQLKVNDPYTVGTYLADAGFTDILYNEKTVEESRIGYTFRGWDEKNNLADDATPAYKNGTVIRVTPYNSENVHLETQMLYGYWKKDKINFRAYTYENGDIDNASKIYEGTWWQNSTQTMQDAAMGSLYDTAVVAGSKERTKAESWTGTDNSGAVPAGYEFAYAKVDGTEIKGLRYDELPEPTGEGEKRDKGYFWQYTTDGSTWVKVQNKAIDIYYYKNPLDVDVYYVVVDDDNKITKQITLSGTPAVAALADLTSTSSANETISVNTTAQSVTGEQSYKIGTVDYDLLGYAVAAKATTDVLDSSLTSMSLVNSKENGVTYNGTDNRLQDNVVYVVYHERPSITLTVTKTWVDNGATNNNNTITLTFTNGTTGADFTGITQTDENVTVSGNAVTLSKVHTGTEAELTYIAWPESWTVIVPADTTTVDENPVDGYVKVINANLTDTDSDGTDSIDDAYTVAITNTRAIVKITDVSGNLLYKADGTPAVYTTATALEDAFGDINNDGTTSFYTTAANDTAYSGAYKVQMLVENYTQTGAATLDSGKTVTLTTAASTDTDGFPGPYTGTAGTEATITRGYDGASMFTTAGGFTTTNIVLDGGNQLTSAKACTGNGGIINATAGTVTLDDNTKLQNSTAVNGGAIYMAGGGLNIHSETGTNYINDCVATANGGAIYLANGVNAGEDDLVIDGHVNLPATTKNAVNGGGIYLENGSSFTFTGGEIIDCAASGNGGGLFSNGTLTMTEVPGVTTQTRGTIASCSAVNGGGVYIGTTGEMTMTGGTVDNCTASGNGGGIYTASTKYASDDTKSEVVMSADTDHPGVISNCSANNGGGIYVAAGELDMTGGQIKNCHAANNGGGVYNTAKFKMEHTGNYAAGLIENCYAGENGGAIYEDNANSVLVLTDITIQGHTASGLTAGTANAKNGGAIYVNAGGMTLTGSRIYDCTASVNGGAIYDYSSTKLEISGTTINGHVALDASTKNAGSNGGNTGDNYDGNGGGIYMPNRGDSSTNIAALKISNCNFYNLTAFNMGGAIYSDAKARNSSTEPATVMISNTTIDGHYDSFSTEEKNASSGGGIFMKSGWLTMTGGAINNCTVSENGGALYNMPPSTAIESGRTVILTSVTINGGENLKNAGANGGGIFMKMGKLTLDSCTLTNLEAEEGAAIYAGTNDAGNNAAEILVKSSSVTQCYADKNSPTGAIDIKDDGSRIPKITFEGNTVVRGNYNRTHDTAHQHNVVLEINRNNTIFTSNTGLADGANIGIYVTGTTTPLMSQTDPYAKHGNPGQPFGTHGSGNSNLSLNTQKDKTTKFFVSDRDGSLYGVLGTGSNAAFIVWHRDTDILTVTKTWEEITGLDNQNTQIVIKVLDSDGHELALNPDLQLDVSTHQPLYPNVTIDTADTHRAILSKSAENQWPANWTLVVPSNVASVVEETVPGYVETGNVFTTDVNEDYFVTITNARAVCKITYADPDPETGNQVLYKAYASLADAFNDINNGSSDNPLNDKRDIKIQMLVPETVLTTGVTLNAGKTATLTTAGTTATTDDPYVYTGTGTATIKRGSGCTDNLITNNGTLTLTNIKLDGNSVSADGALVANGDNSALTLTNGSELTGNKSDSGAVTNGNGAAVNVSGSAKVSDNTDTAGKAKNIVLDLDSNAIIHVTGELSNNIGVYVTDTQRNGHGISGKPFATDDVTGGSTAASLAHLVNDRETKDGTADGVHLTGAPGITSGTIMWEVSMLTVSKTVTGAMGDTTRDFTFTLTVPAPYTDDTFRTMKDTTEGTLTTSTRTFTLKHGESIELYLPYNAEFSITEGEVTGYKTWMATDSELANAGKTLDTIEETAESTNRTKAVTLTGEETLNVRNRLDSISPTGVSLTYAPYLLMMLFGGLLLALRRRRRYNR